MQNFYDEENQSATDEGQWNSDQEETKVDEAAPELFQKGAFEAEHVSYPEEEGTTVKIDLSGGAQPQGMDEGAAKNAFYTERIQKPKKKKQSRRVVAAMVALTLCNLALFAGAFLLGRSYGEKEEQISSKQELVNHLREEGQESHTAEIAKNGTEMATTEIAKKVGPAVVGITSTFQGQINLFGGTSASSTQGSGIILSEDGYIVTNHHVVAGVSGISVTLNTGTNYEAKVVGLDEQTDLAVIKIEPKEQLTVANLGDSTALEVGERVVAIGNPMGLEFFGSVTQGIVSAVNRSITVDNRTMNLIQTDAAVNSGNSGGALINGYGEVVGINSVKVATSGVEGMSFAIPISEANPIISDLLEYGYVKGRPIIGISTRDVTAYMAASYSWPQGVQILSVSSDSARSAGLQQGDIIVSVNGQKISTGEELNQIKDQHKPGEQLTLEVYKYSTGRKETVKVTLGEQLPG